mmetsp:Transcript_57280/g.136165  ORF Transcript_57280/g.136165 Transcript_57280/m.136165 type:complete len:233 (-) Transcript_57280:69-767(-)
MHSAQPAVCIKFRIYSTLSFRLTVAKAAGAILTLISAAGSLLLARLRCAHLAQLQRSGQLRIASRVLLSPLLIWTQEPTSNSFHQMRRHSRRSSLCIPSVQFNHRTLLSSRSAVVSHRSALLVSKSRRVGPGEKRSLERVRPQLLVVLCPQEVLHPTASAPHRHGAAKPLPALGGRLYHTSRGICSKPSTLSETDPGRTPRGERMDSVAHCDHEEGRFSTQVLSCSFDGSDF